MLVFEDRIRSAFLGYSAGDSVHLHAHLESDEVFFVVSGSATFEIEDETFHVCAGDLLYVAAGERHAILVPDEPLVILAVVAPNRADAWVPEAASEDEPRPLR